ncbi:MAG TPA: response regulator [Stellaceae bacterium]|nr:response regulator [Stellaceae bacterium]
MRHVLVVDDEVEVCRAVQTGLERAGQFRVTAAREGAAAVSMIDASRPDLMIIDAVLPGLSGIDLAELAVGRRIPFLLATGHDDVARLLIDEGWPVLRKPFRLATLVRDVEAAIRDGEAHAGRVRASFAQPARIRTLQSLVRRHRTPCGPQSAPARDAQKQRALLEEDPDTLRAAFHMIENFGTRAADVAERRAQSASNEEVMKRWLLVARAIRKLAPG